MVISSEDVQRQLPREKLTMDITVKEIAAKLGIEEVTVRSMIALAELKARGDGPKPKKGVTPKTYRFEDVEKIWKYLKDFQETL